MKIYLVVSDYIFEYGCIIYGPSLVILRTLLKIYTGILLRINRLYFQNRSVVNWPSNVTSEIKIDQL